MIIYDYKLKRETKYDNKNRIVSILNGIRNSILYFYLHHKTIFELTEK